MLGIITCIRHPNSAKDFEKIKSLLSDTVRNLENQSLTHFKFYIVCNTGSNLVIKSHINFDIIEVDMDCPEYIEVVDDCTEGIKRQSVIKDKGVKYYFGLQQAKIDSLDYVMFIDADDYLHRNVVQYIDLNKSLFDGIIVDKGYSYAKSSVFLGEMSGFNRICGTCNSYKMSIIEKFIPEQHFKCQKTILENVDNDFIFNILGSHLNAKAFIKKQGGNIGFFPFYASMYLVDHGENDSRVSHIIGKPIVLDKDIMNDFSLNDCHDSCLWNFPFLLYYRIQYYLKPKLKLLKRWLVNMRRLILSR